MTSLKKNLQVALYTGPGAEKIKDVERAIRNRVPYHLINASEVRNGVLDNYKLLIMSGGYTAHYIPNLKPKGCESIKDFLYRGGRYLGICAGAYIAATPELGITKSKMIRKSGIFNCEIKIQDLTHPIFRGINKSTLIVYYQNGPHIVQKEKGEKSLAFYVDGTASVIETLHALIFSWHPEKLPHTIPILLKSIKYLIER
ncbi:MAG: BPL-N domain-containing protein [Promethearchaeota archaeon]